MKKNNTLSIIVLVGNEEKLIEACLKSCKFADENILVMANSTEKVILFTQTLYMNVWPLEI